MPVGPFQRQNQKVSDQTDQFSGLLDVVSMLEELFSKSVFAHWRRGDAANAGDPGAYSCTLGNNVHWLTNLTGGLGRKLGSAYVMTL